MTETDAEREPDYEAIIEARQEERHEQWMERMDAIYGRPEHYRGILARENALRDAALACVDPASVCTNCHRPAGEHLSGAACPAVAHA